MIFVNILKLFKVPSTLFLVFYSSIRVMENFEYSILYSSSLTQYSTLLEYWKKFGYSTLLEYWKFVNTLLYSSSDKVSTFPITGHQIR